MPRLLSLLPVFLLSSILRPSSSVPPFPSLCTPSDPAAPIIPASPPPETSFSSATYSLVLNSLPPPSFPADSLICTRSLPPSISLTSSSIPYPASNSTHKHDDLHPTFCYSPDQGPGEPVNAILRGLSQGSNSFLVWAEGRSEGGQEPTRSCAVPFTVHFSDPSAHDGTEEEVTPPRVLFRPPPDPLLPSLTPHASATVSKYGNMFTLSSDDYVGQSLRVLGEVREIIRGCIATTMPPPP